MVLGCIEGRQVKDIASEMNERPNTVIMWRNRFSEEGIRGLLNRPRGKHFNDYGPDLRERILGLIESDPPPYAGRWTGTLLSSELGVPADVVWRCLRKEGIRLADRKNAAEVIVIDVPLQLTGRKERIMKKNGQDMMDLEIVARIKGKDGTVIEKVIRMDDAIPTLEDFDLSTREGFLRDVDVLERCLLSARDEMTIGLASGYVEEASKKNGKRKK